MLNCIGIWSLSSLCHIIIYAIRWRILFVLYMHFRIVIDDTYWLAICWFYIFSSHSWSNVNALHFSFFFLFYMLTQVRWAHCPRNHLNYVDFTFALSISLIICTSTWLKFFEGFSQFQCSVFIAQVNVFAYLNPNLDYSQRYSFGIKLQINTTQPRQNIQRKYSLCIWYTIESRRVESTKKKRREKNASIRNVCSEQYKPRKIVQKWNETKINIKTAAELHSHTSCARFMCFILNLDKVLFTSRCDLMLPEYGKYIHAHSISLHFGLGFYRIPNDMIDTWNYHMLKSI